MVFTNLEVNTILNFEHSLSQILFLSTVFFVTPLVYLVTFKIGSLGLTAALIFIVIDSRYIFHFKCQNIRFKVTSIGI